MQEIIKLLETNKKGVEESAIRETEQKLNVRFPDQYVQLFKLTNGPEVWRVDFISHQRSEEYEKNVGRRG